MSQAFQATASTASDSSSSLAVYFKQNQVPRPAQSRGEWKSIVSNHNATQTASAAVTVSNRQREVEAFVELHRNHNTKRTYEAGWSGFMRYLNENQVKPESITQWEIAHYLQERVKTDGVSASTVRLDKASIADGIRARYPQLEHILYEKKLNQLVAVLKKTARQPKPKRHMEVELMRAIIQLVEDKPPLLVSWIEERNVCLMLLMMMGMLRESEAVALTLSDAIVQQVQVNSVAMMVLELRVARSKTDQAGVGASILIGAQSGRPNECPIVRLNKYLVQYKARVSKGELQGGDLAWLFPQKNGSQMSSSTPAGIVQRAVLSVNDAVCEVTGQENKWENQWSTALIACVVVESLQLVRMECQC